jgi:hypothetical protein
MNMNWVPPLPINMSPCLLHRRKWLVKQLPWGLHSSSKKFVAFDLAVETGGLLNLFQLRQRVLESFLPFGYGLAGFCRSRLSITDWKLPNNKVRGRTLSDHILVSLVYIVNCLTLYAACSSCRTTVRKRILGRQGCLFLQPPRREVELSSLLCKDSRSPHVKMFLRGHIGSNPRWNLGQLDRGLSQRLEPTHWTLASLTGLILISGSIQLVVPGHNEARCYPWLAPSPRASGRPDASFSETETLNSPHVFSMPS